MSSTFYRPHNYKNDILEEDILKLSDSDPRISFDEGTSILSHFERKDDSQFELTTLNYNQELVTLDQDPIIELAMYIHKNCLPVDLVNFSIEVSKLSSKIINNSLSAQKYFKRNNIEKLNEFIENIKIAITEFFDCISNFTYKVSSSSNDLQKLFEKVTILFKSYKTKYVERDDNINSNLEIEWACRKREIEYIVDRIQKEKDDKSTSKKTKNLLMYGFSKFMSLINEKFQTNTSTPLSITDDSSLKK